MRRFGAHLCTPNFPTYLGLYRPFAGRYIYIYTNRLPKQTLQYKPKGRRNIGRPRKRWSDHFILRIKEQETRLTLQEHDDNDDDIYIYIYIYLLVCVAQEIVKCIYIFTHTYTKIQNLISIILKLVLTFIVKIFTLKNVLEFNRTDINGNNSLRIILADPSGRAVLDVCMRPAGLLGLRVRIPLKARASDSCECFAVKQRSMRRADHSSTGVLPSVVCLSMITIPRK